MEHNIIRDFVEGVGMNPDAATIGAIGAIIAVIWKVNGYSFRKSSVIILGGFCLCGYLYASLTKHWPMPQATLYLLMFLFGFISNHVYRFLDESAPEILELGFNYVSSFIKKKK